MFAPLWRGQEERDHRAGPTSCSSASSSIKKREDFAGSLSGGQRKLLEMARALMADPELVMLDEPMAGVNPALKQSLLGHVKSLRDEGTTVLFVEHDMDMVRDISDWVIVMAQGKVIAEGPPDTVMGDQRVIDAYLGAAPRHSDLSRGWRSRSSPRPQAEIAENEERGDRTPTADRGSSTVTDAEQPTATDRSAHLKAAEGAVLRADDLIAGYLPGRQHPQRLPTSTCHDGRAGRHHRPQRRRQVDAAQGDVRPGEDPLRHGARSRARTSPTSGPTTLVAEGVGFVPQTNNVFPSLTIEENLEMGVFQRPK